MSIEYRKPKTLSQLEDENAKLREQIHWLKQGDILHVLTDQEYIDQCERERLMQVSIDALYAENDRLRELLKNALTYIEYEGCGVECPETGHGATLTSCDICNRYESESCAYVIEQDARELGIGG